MQELFKNNLENLLKINKDISSLLQVNESAFKKNKDFFESFQADLQKLLIKKEIVIKSMQELKETSESVFSELKTNEFIENWEELKSLEAENLSLIKNHQKNLVEEKAGVKIQSKAINSYKFNKEIKSRLFDDSF